MPILRTYQCPLCDLTFHGGDTLTGHIKKWHRVEESSLKLLGQPGIVDNTYGVGFVQPYVYISDERFVEWLYK